MPLLLDTHTWIWSQALPERLGPSAASLLSEPDELLYLSTVSTLELARLQAHGRAELSEDLSDFADASLDLLGASTIEMSHEIAIGAYTLPGDFHRDPADRILVSTARLNGLTLLTADERILGYPHVESRDARQ